MVALGRIPAVVRPPYVTITPAIPGAFRWSGTTILIFTPDAKTPLPFATRYDVTVDCDGRRRSAAARSARRTRSASRRRRSSCCEPRPIAAAAAPTRRSSCCMRFNQPVDPADVAAQLSARFTPHEWDTPVLSADGQKRLAAIDSDVARTLQRQGRRDQRRRVVERAGHAAADERLGQEALPAGANARGLRDGDRACLPRAGSR